MYKHDPYKEEEYIALKETYSDNSIEWDYETPPIDYQEVEEDNVEEEEEEDNNYYYYYNLYHHHETPLKVEHDLKTSSYYTLIGVGTFSGFILGLLTTTILKLA